MSHFVKCKTSIKNKSMLKRALSKMGLTFTEGEFTITQYGQSEKAQIKFENALGLQEQKDGTFMVVGDPYHCSNQKLRKYYGKMQEFESDLKIAYTVVETVENMESMNFSCVENQEGTVGKNGKIRMVFETVCG